MGDFNNNMEIDAGRELQMDLLGSMAKKAIPYRYPEKMEFVKRLPKTQSYKIKRRLPRETRIDKKKE